MTNKVLSGFLLTALAFTLPCASFAYDATTDANLRRSRDALLDQEQHLREAADRINAQIQRLQEQLGTVNDYLRDTDNAIRDVERSLRSE